MSGLSLLLIGIIVAVPTAWLVSEFRGTRLLRITLGILAIGVMVTCLWALSSMLTQFNYNASYGGATGDLISTSLKQIEDGHLDRVLKVWRGLDLQYHPTYEHQARYKELVEEAIARMRGDTPIEIGSAWDASVFSSKTWVGHWEDGLGYWIVINDTGKPFDLVQSGQPRAKAQSISISPDFRILKFKEGEQWLHTLTLKNKYEANYEWFDLQKGTVRETRPVYKLIRASDEQKAVTQQNGVTNRAPSVRPETNRTPAAAGSKR